MLVKSVCFLILIIVASNELYALKCKCTSNGDDSDPSDTSCNASGECQTDGVCVIVSQPGAVVRQCQANSTTTGCLTTVYPKMGNIKSTQCMCNKKDFCNAEIGNCAY